MKLTKSRHAFVGLVNVDVLLIVSSLLVINYSFQKLSHTHAHRNFNNIYIEFSLKVKYYHLIEKGGSLRPHLD